VAGRLENPVLVAGFRELNADLKATNPAMLKAMRTGLTLAMQPIKRDADRFSVERLSGMKRAKRKPPPWSLQKIGETTREVYMVPTEKGARARRDSKLRRPNFANLMLGKSYDPALEQNRVQVANTVDHVIGTVTRTF
jgi:hypothetical protein